MVMVMEIQIASGEAYNNFQRLLGSYGGYLENVQLDSDRYDAMSPYSSYAQSYSVNESITVNIHFKSMPATIEFMQQIANDCEAARRREKLMKKYPSVREAWNHYKAIEALCNDDEK
jgi:hypothetical protein